jgi:hypothetical protein
VNAERSFAHARAGSARNTWWPAGIASTSDEINTNSE